MAFLNKGAGEQKKTYTKIHVESKWSTNFGWLAPKNWMLEKTTWKGSMASHSH